MTSFPFNAVIFDVDGTLALTADLHFDAFNAAAQAQGYGMTRAWYDLRKGLDRVALTEALARDVMAQAGFKLDRMQMVEASLELTIAHAREIAVENPPIARFARSLSGRVPIAVGSNAETPVVLAVLDGAGLSSLFEVVVTVSDTGRAKPDPAIFSLAAQRLGADPTQCLVLEDSDEGLAAARRAGMIAWDVRDPAILAQLDGLESF